MRSGAGAVMGRTEKVDDVMGDKPVVKGGRIPAFLDGILTIWSVGASPQLIPSLAVEK